VSLGEPLRRERERVRDWFTDTSQRLFCRVYTHKQESVHTIGSE